MKKKTPMVVWHRFRALRGARGRGRCRVCNEHASEGRHYGSEAWKLRLARGLR